MSKGAGLGCLPASSREQHFPSYVAPKEVSFAQLFLKFYLLIFRDRKKHVCCSPYFFALIKPATLVYVMRQHSNQLSYLARASFA